MDIDQALLELILDRHGAELGGQVDVPAVRWEVERAAEQIKIHLSTEQEWDEPLNLRSARTFLDVSFTRKDLNLVAEPFVQRVIEAIDRCLKKAPEGALSPSDVSEVILVGSSSKLPLFQTRLAQKFGKEGRCDLNPMEVVALGAAYQAEHAERTGALITIHSDDLVTRTLDPLRDLVRSVRERSDRLDHLAGVALANLEAAVSANDVEGARTAKGRLIDALFELGISIND